MNDSYTAFSAFIFYLLIILSYIGVIIWFFARPATFFQCCLGFGLLWFSAGILWAGLGVYHYLVQRSNRAS